MVQPPAPGVRWQEGRGLLPQPGLGTELGDAVETATAYTSKQRQRIR